MKRIVVETPGGPEQMKVVEAPKPVPGPKEAVVKIAFSGVNFIDVYYRTGLYKGEVPIVLGSEASGTVDSIGSEVTEVNPGDRVAYTMVRGSYAEYAAVPAAQLVKVPDGVDLKTAAAVMLQGTTAHYLTHSTYKLEQGSTCVVHAAAGGTGGLIVQMAKHLGARVFGTVSSEAKARQVRDLGADEAIIYTTQDFEVEVKRLTNGTGVDVVYDSVGKTTFDKSLNVLRPRGTMALFGQSSGVVPPFDPAILNAKGSLFLTRPTLAHHLLDRKELLWRVSDVFGYIASGAVKVRESGIYPLAEAASAHEVLEGRRTLGKLLLKIGN
jgi:NADPH2:quinone reductase